MGGDRAPYKPYEAAITTDPNSPEWQDEYVRAQGTGTNTQGQWRAGYGNDVGGTFRVGQQQNGSGQWRPPYGGDVGTTFKPGQQQPPQEAPQQPVQQPGNGQWRPPYGGDVGTTYRPGQPNDPNRNGNGDTGPVWDPTRGGTRPLPGYDQPAQGTQVAGSQSGDPQVAGKVRLVDAALDYNTVGYGGNLVAGAGGAVLGKHTLPWAMEQLAKTVKLDSNRETLNLRQVFGMNPTEKPMGFRERLVGYWQDNHNSATWNRGDIVATKRDLTGLVDESRQIFDRNSSRLKFAQTRHDLLKDLLDPTVDRVKAVDHALTSNTNARGLGRALFTSQELKWLDEFKASGTMPDGLKRSITATSNGLAARSTRDAVFKILGDNKVPLSSRQEMVAAALSDIEGTGKAARYYTNSEAAMLRSYQTAAAESAAAVEQGRLGAIKQVGNKYGRTIVRGAGIAAAFMVADHYLDKAMGKDHQNGIGSSLNSMLVPMALLATENRGTKATLGIGLAGLVGGKLIGSMLDSALPEGEYPRYSRYFRQGTAESLLLGAEFLIPMKAVKPGAMLNWKRAALMGGTWAAFRVKNAVFDAAPPSETKDEAFGLLKHDARVKSDGSMTDAINKFRELGASTDPNLTTKWNDIFKAGWGKGKAYIGEAALHTYRTEWLTRPNSSFASMEEAYRGATILCTAFGESRLKHGTHVFTKTDDPEYILEGKNLDLGGKAAREFIIARVNIDRAKEGLSPDQAKDLDEVKKRIEASEAKIYGEHDIEGAVQELAHWGQGMNSTHVTKLLLDTKNTIAANQNSSDKRFLAKLYRDTAVFYLAAAERFKGGDPRAAQGQLYGDQYQGQGADGAEAAIRRARELDPNNPDLQKLDQIFSRLAQEVPGRVQQQSQDPRFDPNQVRR